MNSANPNSPNTNLWPDTWVVYWGEGDSAFISKYPTRIERTQQNMRMQIDPGRACPQPVIGQDASGVVVFDGILYNPVEIEAWIGQEKPGSNLAETLLKAYQIAGEGLFTRLKGRFSLILWDFSRQMLLAVRDPIGIYPLFYANDQTGCCFSISIEALVKQPRISNELERAVIADYLALRWPFKDETFYQSVKRVPPGHFIRRTEQELELVRYWTPIPANGKVDWINQDVEEKFEVVLNQATSDLLAYGPAGIYLSGGLDSVTAAALASDHARQIGQQPPFGLSLIFPSAEFPEEPIQRGVAQSLGIQLYITTLAEAASPKGLIPAALEMSGVWPVPMMNLWRPAYHHLAKVAVENDCKMILSGAGGDEWLGLTPYYAADLVRRANMPGLYRLLKGYYYSYHNPIGLVMWRTLWSFGLRPLLTGIAARQLSRVKPEFLTQRRKRKNLRSNPDWLKQEGDLQAVLACRMERRIEEAAQEELPESFYLREIGHALDHSLVSLELEEEFESGRRIGIPVLGFYQHQDLLSFLFQINPEILNTGKPGKGLVRSILNRRFPELGFGSQKKTGATNVFRGLIEKESHVAWKILGGAEGLVKMGIVRNSAVQEFITGKDNLQKGGASAFAKWNILNVEKWVRTHNRAS